MRDFWNRFERFANSLKVDSVSIGIARVGFRSDAFSTPAYDQILDILARATRASQDVFVITAHNVDEVYTIDAIKSDHECASDTYTVSPGGSGANTAYALGRMGWSTEVAGVVGGDRFGALIRESFREAHVRGDLLREVPDDITGRTSTIVEDTGRRLIVVRPGANDQFEKQLNYDELLERVMTSRVFHSSSFVSSKSRLLQERLLAAAKGEVLTSLTPGALYSNDGLDRIEPLLRNINVMFLYREQLQTLVENSSAKALLKGSDTQSLLATYFAWKSSVGFATPQVVVVKDPLQITSGMLAQGFLCAGVGCTTLERFIPPHPFERKVRYQAKDTTGAGDCSAAGMIHGILRGLALSEAVDTAFFMAALASTEIGARAALRPEQLRTPDVLTKSTEEVAFLPGD